MQSLITLFWSSVSLYMNHRPKRSRITYQYHFSISLYVFWSFCFRNSLLYVLFCVFLQLLDLHYGLHFYSSKPSWFAGLMLALRSTLFESRDDDPLVGLLLFAFALIDFLNQPFYVQVFTDTRYLHVSLYKSSKGHYL